MAEHAGLARDWRERDFLPLSSSFVGEVGAGYSLRYVLTISSDAAQARLSGTSLLSHMYSYFFSRLHCFQFLLERVTAWAPNSRFRHVGNGMRGVGKEGLQLTSQAGWDFRPSHIFIISIRRGSLCGHLDRQVATKTCNGKYTSRSLSETEKWHNTSSNCDYFFSYLWLKVLK